MTRRWTVVAVFLIAGIVGGSGPVGSGSHVASRSLPVAAADSERTLREAMLRVRLFYTRYRDYAYPRFTGEAVFVCEKLVWPYCFGPRNGHIPYAWRIAALPVLYSTSDAILPRDIARRVTSLSRDLVRDLANKQKVIPGDRWIFGQRVFHLMANGQPALARELIADCKAERWWCAALLGHTSHALRDFDRADSAFAVALAAMPAEQRCRWNDVTDLVYDDPSRGWYSSMTCAQRAQANETLWWLADPLYITPGNERRTAHYSRAVYAILFQDSRLVMPSRDLSAGNIFTDRQLWDWGSFTSILRAMGPPTYVIPEYISTRSLSNDPPLLLLQYPPPTYAFLPTMSAVKSPLTADSAWALESREANERYNPSFGRMASLAHQVAFFKRGDSARMIASADLKFDTVLMRSGLLAMKLALTNGPSELRITDERVLGTRVTFDVMTPRESTIVSIEAVGPGVGAGRARTAAGPPVMPAQRVTISDLLLLDDPADVPTDLDDAVPNAGRSGRVVEGSPISAFWEVYGLANSDTVTYTFSAIERGTSVLARMSRIVGIQADPPSPRVLWTERVEAAAPITPKTVTLDISALPRGRYTLRLQVSVPGQLPLSATRTLEVMREQVIFRPRVRPPSP